MAHKTSSLWPLALGIIFALNASEQQNFITIPNEKVTREIADGLFNIWVDEGGKKANLDQIIAALTQAKHPLGISSTEQSLPYIQVRQLISATSELYKTKNIANLRTELFKDFFVALLKKNGVSENIQAIKDLQNDPLSPLSGPSKELKKLRQTMGYYD